MTSADANGPHLEALAALIGAHRDVLEERVESPDPPGWCEARGWAPFLDALDERTLAAAERKPATALSAHPDAPPSLRALATRIRELTALPRLGEVAAPAIRKASASKRAQVAALRALLAEAGASAGRVVDYGAGRGHLTRALARALDLPALGLERREAVVEEARALGEPGGVRFEARDARAGDPELRSDDLLVGLHACGELGDALIRTAAETGCPALLVPCCPQKIAGERRAPLSARATRLDLGFDRRTLGLANLGALEDGPIPREDAIERRRLRYALRLLLTRAGLTLRAGDESRGINRKRFRGPLAPLVEHAFERRGLPAPSAEAITRADREAQRDHARIRRLALPRTMLARVLEVTIALDRAAALEERGRHARVVEAFPRRVSPRNLAVVGVD